MNKSDVKEMFKNNVINWYDFDENSSIFHFFEDVELTQKYDYIIVHEKLELLDLALEHLNPDGTIILLLNNKFAISNFVTENGMEKNLVSYSKLEIEQKLKSMNLNYKFFYPLPNNEITNCVYSDDYLPKVDSTKINNNNLYETKVYLNELTLLKNTVINGKFTEFTNSYFVEINPKTKIKFASFNNLRNEKYRLCTRIYDDHVEKSPINDTSIEHINQIKENIDSLRRLGFNIIDKYENGKIISSFMKCELFYQVLVRKFCNNEVGEAIKLIEKWYNYINKKISKCSKIYIDLIFENMFYINDEFLFFDQEWVEENVPNEFIIYRAINNLYTYSNEISKFITEKELLERFDLLDRISEFDEIEKNFQRGKIDGELNKLFNDFVPIVDIIIDRDERIKELTNANNFLNNNLETARKNLEDMTNNFRLKCEMVESLEKEIQLQRDTNGNLAKELHKQNEINIELNKLLDDLTIQLNAQNEKVKYYQNMKLVKFTSKLRERKNRNDKN